MNVLCPDDSPKVKTVKVGEVIEVDEEIEENCKKYKKYTVIKVFPHHVLCVNKLNFRRSFSYWDLVTMGKEVQEPRIEAMRRGIFGKM
ncbi:MAG: hypothetical protein ACI4TA_04685 [Acetatifactor sp.]